jgi:ribonuclease P protein component
MGKYTFPKSERLNREAHIKELFEKGSSFNLYPFRVVFSIHPDQKWPSSQVLITVSSRNFKKAADRNLLKRRIRESYRLNKHNIISQKKLLLAYIYTAKEILPQHLIEEKIIKACHTIRKKSEASDNERQ